MAGAASSAFGDASAHDHAAEYELIRLPPDPNAGATPTEEAQYEQPTMALSGTMRSAAGHEFESARYERVPSEMGSMRSTTDYAAGSSARLSMPPPPPARQDSDFSLPDPPVQAYETSEFN